MKKRYTEEQIIRILKEHEGGRKASDIAREHGITEQTFYRWKSKYGGMEVNEAKRLKELENENRRLKEMVADLSLENKIKDEVIKKMVKPSERRRVANKIQEYYEISERMAARIMAISQNTKRYAPKENLENVRLTERLKELSSRYPRYGYRRLHILLLREGEEINIKRTYRLYKEAGLLLKKKTKKRRYEKRGMPENPLRMANSRWAMDFVSDRTRAGAAFRVLVVIDSVTKECLALEADNSLGGRRVGQVLNRIAMFRGYPDEILSDNGAEFTSNVMNEWSYDHNVKQIFIDPGKPMQNGAVESLNGKFRTECLNQHWFRHLSEAQELIEEWRHEYNNFRPHMSLDYKTPVEYAEEIKSVN